MGLSDVTVSIHPFRFGQEGGGQGGIRLKPRGCRHPSKEARQPELEKAAAIPQRFLLGDGEEEGRGSLLNGAPGQSHLWKPSPVICVYLRQQTFMCFIFGGWTDGVCCSVFAVWTAS